MPEIQNGGGESTLEQYAALAEQVETHFPRQDIKQRLAELNGTTVDALDPDTIEWAESQEKKAVALKQLVVAKVRESGISVAEVSPYLQTAFELAQYGVRQWPNFNPLRVLEDFLSLVGRYRSSDEMMGVSKLSEQWEHGVVEIADKQEQAEAQAQFWHILSLSEKARRGTFSEVFQEFMACYRSYLQRTHTQNDLAQKFLHAEEQLSTVNSELMKPYRTLFEVIYRDNSEVEKTFLEDVRHYASVYGLSPEEADAFANHLLPAMRDGNPEVGGLRIGNTWGMKPGEYGIADFTMRTYALPVAPRSINELLMILRQIPTGDTRKFEQNRRDALTLMVPFGALRDLIHDQQPLTRSVIEAMVEYYDDGNPDALKALLPRTGGYLGGPERMAAILDRGRYDKEIEEYVPGGSPITTTGIQVLRRLLENTKVFDDIPPAVTDEELRESMGSIVEEMTSDGVGAAVARMNVILETQMRASVVGLVPSIVKAIAWLEHKASMVLQGLTYEEQIGAYKKPWFQSLLLFQELTASPGPYDAKEFSLFLRKVSKERDWRTAYRMIADRTLLHVAGLASQYRNGPNREIVGALWSGNVTHELIGLGDPRKATTVYGVRHAKESVIPDDAKNTGD